MKCLSSVKKKVQEGENMAAVRYWKVYGSEGHRLRTSFEESVHYDFSNEYDGVRILDFYNSDRTGTNEFTIARIERNTPNECAKEILGQYSDGYFENCMHIGKCVEISEQECNAILKKA